MKGGQGLIIHTHDCPAIHPFRTDPEKWVDVQWDPTIDRFFSVDIRVTVTDRRGMLAKIAAEIAARTPTSPTCTWTTRSADAYTVMQFTLRCRTACTWPT